MFTDVKMSADGSLILYSYAYKTQLQDISLHAYVEGNSFSLCLFLY